MRAALVLAIWATTALLVGCGAGDGAETTEQRPRQPREAWITLNGYMGAANLGVLMAQERGYFTDLNIVSTVTRPASPEGSIGYVAGQTVEFGVAHQPQVAIERAQGEPIVAVGSLVPHATIAMIWLKGSGIDGIADLKGKTVAVSGLSYEEAFLRAILRRAGLTLEDIKVKRVEFKAVPALVDGRVDAIFGGSWNIEGAALQTRGLRPVVRRAEDLGLPAYDELVLIARTDRVSKEPQLVRDVISAVARGTAAAIEDPESAIAVIEESTEGDPEADRKTTEAEVAATLPLLSRTGYMNPERATDLVDWMHEEGLIEQTLPASEWLTNRYVTP
jgi:putative hydroxymethylpyrimidine transport system substrate-binding protein